MRQLLASSLFDWMAEDERVVILTADLGFRFWDKIRAAYPDRFFTVGAAEQLLVGCGVGLALEGKIPVLYSITPFMLWRPYELIRNYIDHEQIPVKMVGCGYKDDYAHDGFSHYGDVNTHQFKNIKYLTPQNKEKFITLFKEFKDTSSPVFLCVRR